MVSYPKGGLYFMYLKVGEVAKQIGVTTQTIRDWEKKGVFKPKFVNESGTRFYTQKQVDIYLGVKEREREFKVIGYCRVSSPSQKDDLERQVELMDTYLKYRYDS